MDMDDGNSSSSSSSTVAASKQLHRRLNGLGRSHWSFTADYELVSHLKSIDSTDSMLHLDILSDCIFRMAEHVHKALPSKTAEAADCMVSNDGYLMLCTVLGVALQQLAEGVRKFLQQGQLPAALTERATDACSALCFAFNCICDWFKLNAKQYSSTEGERSIRQMCYNQQVEGGARVGALLLAQQPEL
jgi:hypothetical protein